MAEMFTGDPAVNALAKQFLHLEASQKRKIHIELCQRALHTWHSFCESVTDFSYVETVCGTKQVVDPQLPADAFNAVSAATCDATIAKRYLEPITALQDDDLEFPNEIEYAFYAIYNLYRKYITHSNIDDWLIVGQVLSSEGKGEFATSLLTAAMQSIRIDRNQAMPNTLTAPDGAEQ